MAQTQAERLAEKTAERQVLFPSSDNGEVRGGQMRVTVVSVGEPSGKQISEMKKVGVVVRVDGGLEDLEVLKRFGTCRWLRRQWIRVEY